MTRIVLHGAGNWCSLALCAVLNGWQDGSRNTGGRAHVSGTFVFIHGTGRQDVQANEKTIRGQLALVPELAGFDYVGVDWTDLAPGPVDVIPALPAHYAAFFTGSAVPSGQEALAGFAGQLYREAKETEASATGGLVRETSLRILTDALEQYRAPLTASATDFLANVVFYLKRGSGIRRFVQQVIGGVDQSSPVVVVGHSLGGVIAIDLLSDPDWRSDAEGLRAAEGSAGQARLGGRVDLMVTVGSQAPLLYLMDALTTLRPGFEVQPFSPWLNIFNPRDPLGFRAAEVFSWADTPPTDAVVLTPRDLPAVHADYIAQPAVYDEIADALAQVHTFD